jgi:hypothetical protein
MTDEILDAIDDVNYAFLCLQVAILSAQLDDLRKRHAANSQRLLAILATIQGGPDDD